jgi:hypothetical protein
MHSYQAPGLPLSYTPQSQSADITHSNRNAAVIALQLANVLNSYLRSLYEVSENLVVVSSFLTPDGSISPLVDNKVLIRFLTIEQSQKAEDGLLYDNLFYLVSANFSEHTEAIKMLSSAADFFKMSFSEAGIPSAFDAFEIKTLSRANMSVGEMAGLYPMLGGSHIPSVLYKVSMCSWPDEYLASLPVEPLTDSDTSSERRLLNLIEENVRLILRDFVFSPNREHTWLNIRYMIQQYLYRLWKNGMIKGERIEDAYSVQVGLGSTMTGDDILNGIINVVVILYLDTDPLTLTFTQTMAGA